MVEVKKNIREELDYQPLEMPSGFKKPESIAEMMQRLVRTSISQQAQEQGFESFEEAEDFEIDDFFDPGSPYEEVFDPVLGRGITYDEFTRNEAVYRQRYEAAQEAAFKAMDVSEALRARRAPSERAKPSTPPAEPLPKPPASEPT